MPNTQVTLVSLYGNKELELAKLIGECQRLVKEALGGRFDSYPVEQVHATIVGLERLPGSILDNRNFSKLRSRPVAMNLDGFISWLNGSGHLPLQVQIGGFKDREYPFVSRNKRPFERSFSVQSHEEGDRVVLMGWPIRGVPLLDAPNKLEAFVQESRLYPLTLDQFRHAAQAFGILHSYHEAPSSVDNDLFFRVGLVDHNSVPLEDIHVLERNVRAHLAGRSPLIQEISRDKVFVAAYLKETLPCDTTNAWSINHPFLDGRFISTLYT